MKIGIDIQTVIDRPTGVGQYVFNLVRGLEGIAGNERFRLFCFDFRRRFDGMGITDPRFEIKRIRFIPGSLYNFLTENLGMPDIGLLAGPCDLYHFPNFIIHPLKRGKAVVTVHDLSFARFPEHAERLNLNRLKKRFTYTIERADAIITVSEFSRRELVKLYGVSDDRITVIHQGVEIPTAEKQGRRFDFDYFLFVGTIEPRKNLGTLLDAWRIVKGRKGGSWKYKLLIAGGTGWRCPPASTQVMDKGLEDDAVIFDYVPNDELHSLYAGAEAFVYPSLYEGFGMPPLEAMARGTPVIASSAPSIPEVVGRAALMVDPRNPEQIAGALVRISEDRRFRAELVDRGLERVKLFSWDKTAHKTLALYRKLLQ